MWLAYCALSWDRTWTWSVAPQRPPSRMISDEKKPCKFLMSRRFFSCSVPNSDAPSCDGALTLRHDSHPVRCSRITSALWSNLTKQPVDEAVCGNFKCRWRRRLLSLHCLIKYTLNQWRRHQPGQEPVSISNFNPSIGIKWFWLRWLRLPGQDELDS